MDMMEKKEIDVEMDMNISWETSMNLINKSDKQRLLKEYVEKYIGDDMDDYLGNVLMTEGMLWREYEGKLHEIYYAEEEAIIRHK